MPSIRAFAMLLAVLGLLAAPGCVATPSQGGSSAPTTTEPAGEVLVVTRANQTRAAGADPRTAVVFGDLSPDRRDEFLAALDGDVRDPTQWDAGTDVEYVRYEDTWYFVTVVVEN